MAFNTGNPLGSTDPRDLYDNAENLDSLVNGEQPSYDDRLGKSRKSWSGMESEFAAFIAASGYEFLGDYAAGIEITQYNQVVRDTNGEFWRASGSTTLPYTTTGAGLPEGGAFVAVGDAVLRQELAGTVASGQGANLVNGAAIYVGSVAELDGFLGYPDGQVAIVASGSTYDVYKFSSAVGAWVKKTTASPREKVIPGGSFNSHKAFGITDCRPGSDIIVVVYRESTVHGLQQSTIKSVRSTDAGVTWSAPQSLFTESGTDARNLGGGYLESGKFVAFFEAVQVSDPTTNNRRFVVTSDDDGATWGTALSLDTPTASRIAPHGRVVNISATEAFQTLYRGDGNLYEYRTTDGGDTWGALALILDDSTYPGAAVGSEPYAQIVNNGTVVMVLRDESASDSSPLVTQSTDGGATWVAPISLTHVRMGKNAPGLYYNKDTDRLSLVWPSRGPDRNPSGGTGMFWPWYITQALGSDAMGIDKWRPPVALPIYSPQHNTSGESYGDSGYHHIFEVGGRKLMSFYRGEGFGTSISGTDLFLADMDLICGWL